MYIFILIFLLVCIIGYIIKLRKEILRDWKRSQIDNSEFIKKYENIISDINLGCSFAPEMWNEEDISKGIPLKALEIIINELKIRDIRLGVRWNTVVKSKDIYDFSFYKPYLDLCIKNKVSLCLNIGPIKTFRWPEEHIPESIFKYKNFNKSSLPKRRSKIFPKSILAKEALNYCDNVLKFLKQEFSFEELKYIKIIQPENEGFNGMGIYRYRMSKSYVEKLINKIHTQFPEKQILLNSAGRAHLRKIVSLFKKLIKDDSTLINKLIAGFDYYYANDYRDKFFLTRIIDSLYFSSPHHLSLNELKKLSKKYNFGIEVTEAQFEPWGQNLNPGNRVNDFKFLILRSYENIFNKNNTDKKIIRLWGIENFVRKYMNNEFTDEHKDILNLIQYIQR